MAAPVSAQLDDGVWEQAALSIEQDGNALSGPGADWLRTEMAGAQSVLVGEQHGVDGLARFTAALEAEFQPDVLVLEAGPWIGDLISADGVREALAFALLAWWRQLGLPGSAPAITGVRAGLLGQVAEP